jgi:hypothetical protein
MTYPEAMRVGQANADKFQQKLVLLRNKQPAAASGGYALIYWHQWCNGVQPPYKTEVVSLIEPR